jgi:hypothetical protein
MEDLNEIRSAMDREDDELGDFFEEHFRSEPRVTRLAVRLVLGCILAELMGGVLSVVDANRAWLLEENRRIEPWEIPIVWSSEMASLLFFFRYSVAMVFPVRGIAAPSSRLTIGVFLVSAAMDASVSLYGLAKDRIAHGRAKKADARVVAGHTFVQETGHRRYSFNVAFRDQAGRDRVVFHSLLARDVPAKVRAAIDKGQFPVDVALLYDPLWSSRSWPAWKPYSNDNRLPFYSLLSLIMSGLVCALLGQLRRRCPSLPPPEIVPFFASVFFLWICAVLQGW